MNTAKTPYKKVQLQHLLDLINANTPIPQGSSLLVLQEIRNAAEKVQEEILENLVSLHGYRMEHYVDWVDKKLYQVTTYGYQTFLSTHLENPLMERLGYNPLSDTDEFQIGKVVQPWMTPKYREWVLRYCIHSMQEYLDILHGIFDFLKQQQLQHRKVEVMAREKEDYISILLERKQQEVYFMMFKVLDFKDQKELIEDPMDFPKCLELNFQNQKTEIINNFHDFEAAITGPYLAQMNDLFEAELLQARIKVSAGVSLHDLWLRVVAQLEELLEQVRQLQQKQAAGPYTKSLQELVSKEDQFQRFLLNWKTGILSGLQEKPGVAQEDIDATISFLLDISEDHLRDFQETISRPSSTWTGQQQQKLALVTQFLERHGCLRDYKYTFEGEEEEKEPEA